MRVMRTKSKPTQPTAEQAFLSRIAEAHQLLDQIAIHLDDHLGVDPESLHWGNAGDAGRVVELLRQTAELCGLSKVLP